MGGSGVTSVNLRHVVRQRDRHGRWRYYFRRGHGPRTALPGEPGCPEFMAAYQQATANVQLGAARYAAGTFGALAAEYFRSVKFKRLGNATQAVTRGIVERFVAVHGHRLVAQMVRKHVERLVAEKADTPAAANNFLKRLRVLLRFAIALGWRKDDPTIGVTRFKEGEWHSWTEDEIAAFEARWHVGSLERTAFALHLYTAQRRADVCVMTWADIAGSKIRVVQAKTGAKLQIEIHPHLRAVLDAWPRKHLTILTSSKGAQYTVESYGNLMADAIEAAGLPARCVLHGLRKAAARRLAEAGCTEKQIAAVTGHRTLSEVARYTRAAEQERLASAAILSLPQGRQKVEG